MPSLLVTHVKQVDKSKRGPEQADWLLSCLDLPQGPEQPGEIDPRLSHKIGAPFPAVGLSDHLQHMGER